MQLIIHDLAKNANKYTISAPDKYGSAHFFQNDLACLLSSVDICRVSASKHYV